MTDSICFITTDFSKDSTPRLPGGCAYYRCVLPASRLSGVETTVGLPAWTGQDGFGVVVGPDRAMLGFDVVVIKLLMQRQIPHQIKIAQELGQKIVVDIDDWHDDLPESNLAFKATDPKLDRITNRDHYKKIIEAADRLVVSTPFLLEEYSKRHSDVVMVRNGPNVEQFAVRKQRNRKPTLGWIGGIPWRGGDLETMRDWLPDFLEKHDLLFHHSGDAPNMGFGTFVELTGVNPERVTTSPLVLIDKYHQQFTFDIGLVPLNDIPFNRAKSTLKGLEYACSGIPFVAQALPEYVRLEELGVGRTASTPAEWQEQIVALLDYRTRATESRQNRDRVQRDHSIDARAAEWARALLEW